MYEQDICGIGGNNVSQIEDIKTPTEFLCLGILMILLFIFCATQINTINS